MHQTAHLETADLKTAISQRRDEATAAVTLTAAHERSTQMHARFTKSRRDGTTLRFIKSGPAHAQKTAGLCDRYGLRLQLVDEPIAHLSSRT